jgi:hypothetical protein
MSKWPVQLLEWPLALLRRFDQRSYDLLVSPIVRRAKSRRFSHLRSYAGELRTRLAALREISGSKFAADEQAILVARSYDRRVAYSASIRDFRVIRFQRFLGRLWFLAFLIAAYLLLGNSTQLSWRAVGLVGLLASLPASLIVFGLTSRLLFRVYYHRLLRLVRRPTFGILTGLLAAVFVWVAFAFGRFHLGLPRWIAAGVALGLLASAVRIFSFLIGQVYYDAAHFTWLWEGYNRAPDALMISRLMNATISVWQSPEQWNELRFRDRASYDIEICARCIDYYVPRVLGPYDADMRAWQLAETRRIAAGIRRLKSFLLLPTPNSRQDLSDKLINVLYTIVTGDWDSLERMEPTEDRIHQPRPSLRRRIFTLLTAIVRASIPLALAIVATQVEFGTLGRPLLTGTIANYVLGAAALYFAVALVMAIDPQLAERVRTAREILGMIPPQEKKEADQSSGSSASR